MNIFTIFFYKILAKYSPKRTKLHNFLKFSRGSMPLNLHFYKNILTPPPPRNEILDTPLFVSIRDSIICRRTLVLLFRLF